MTVNDFQFCGGDISSIDLAEPVLDPSGRKRGLTLAWAIETICEMAAAAGIQGVRNSFSNSMTASQLNDMLRSLKLLCPDDTSLRSSNVFRFLRDSVPLFGPNRTVDLGDGRFQDSWDASTLYGQMVSQYVNGSPFYTSNFSVQAENNVFGGSSYQPYVKTLSRGDPFDYLQIAYTYADPFRLRIRCITRHFNSSQLGQMYANPIYTVTAGGRVTVVSPEVGTRFEVLPKAKTTIPSGIAPYQFPSTYVKSGDGVKWHVLRIAETIYNWDTQARSKSVSKDILVRGGSGSTGATGYELLDCISYAFGVLGISDSDVAEPTLDQVRHWTRPIGVNPYTLQSSISVSYIGCYTVDYLRDRTITPWQRH